MADYNLLPNESVIMKNENVYHGKISGELVLTNLNLIFVTTKGTFKKTNITQQYPVNQIKLFDGKAQAIPGKKGDIDIYFLNGQESFSFWNKETFFSDKKAENEAINFANAINQLLTGRTGGSISPESNSRSGANIVTESLKGTIDSVKGAFGFRSNSSKTIEEVAKKCGFCGAPISGVKGQIVFCRYCDADQQL